MNPKTRAIIQALMGQFSDPPAPAMPSPAGGYGLGDRLDAHYDRAQPSPGRLPQDPGNPMVQDPRRAPGFSDSDPLKLKREQIEMEMQRQGAQAVGGDGYYDNVSQNLDRDQRMVSGGFGSIVPPQPAVPNILPGGDPRGMAWQEGRAAPQGGSFQPGAEYQTADMSKIEPSGVGEANALHATARAFQGLMKGLNDYERLVKEKGTTARPGQHRDDLSTAHYDLLLQMKELYNLGVLNGPDLRIMQEVLIEPTSVVGNTLDLLGGDLDMEKRVPANIENVRRMMLNRTLPALQQLGIDPAELMPKEESDEEFLRSLGLE